MTEKQETAFAAAVGAFKKGEALAEVTEQLLTQLKPEEKLDLLDGDAAFWSGMAEMQQGYNLHPILMGHIARLGIPGLRFSDGPRGVVMGASTAFPVSMARGATWDVALEERIGHAIGKEMRAQGANFFGGVCINLPRHPAWGRVQETYGEDPILLGEMGAALIRGVHRNAMAVAKHYALNSMENARFKVDVTADDATLHEVFLPHFRRCVEEGADGIMTSYNSVNGEWAGQNEVLMEGILRNEWGFKGVTVSDFIHGIRDAAKSLHAGLDVEEPFQQLRHQYLPDDLAEGRASWDDVDRAARRILSTLIRYYASDLDPMPDVGVVFCAEHRALAREAARISMVLIQNQPVADTPLLPLDAAETKSIALIGRLADLPNTGDHGSSDVHSPEVVTPFEGLTAALKNTKVDYVGEDDPATAATAAKAADVAVVVVGYTAEDEGEFVGDVLDDKLSQYFPPRPDAALDGTPGPDALVMSTTMGGDRASLRLRPIDVDIIRATVKANPHTIVVIVTAGAVITEEWRKEVPAVLIGWYSGCEGGAALVEVLFGRTDACGRLPYSIPTTEAHLPYFDREAKAITYDRWCGQRLLDRDGHEAAFPLGFGLSYTTFRIADLKVDTVKGDAFTASAKVTNTGARAGRHVVQLYASLKADDFPGRVLLGFAPVALQPGETKTVSIPASLRPTRRWTADGFVPVSGEFRLEA